MKICICIKENKFRYNTIEQIPKHIYDNADNLLIYNSNYVHLPPLPKKIKKLECHNNPYLETLPKLPKTLKTLYCYGNKLKSIPKLPNTLEELHCFKNKLKSIPELPPNLIYLDCHSNEITYLPKIPDSVYGIHCSSNKIEYIENLPKVLMHFTCRENKLKYLPEIPEDATPYCYMNPYIKDDKYYTSQIIDEIIYQISFGATFNNDLEYILYRKFGIKCLDCDKEFIPKYRYMFRAGFAIKISKCENCIKNYKRYYSQYLTFIKEEEEKQNLIKS